MYFEIKSGDPLQTSCDAMLLGVPAGEGNRPAIVSTLDEAMGGELDRLLGDAGFNGQAERRFMTPTFGAVAPRRVVLVGTGQAGADPDARRRSWAEAARAVVKEGARDIGVAGSGLSETALREALEGIALGSYRFIEYFGTLREDEVERGSGTWFILTEEEDRSSLERVVSEVGTVARAVFLARDLVSIPASDLNPVTMTARATAVAEAHGLDLTVLGVDELERIGAGAILAVGKGSDVPPVMIHMVYRPEGEATGSPIGLVGKCITFDTGGYSIKTGEGMLQMKTDMAGGAAVLGAMSALRQLGIRREVHGVICAAENMISGAAFRPGDVLTAMNGVTIEILSTDAEGRLVLADGLVYTARQGVSEMVDLATLTGAAAVALGDTTALFANDDRLADSLLTASSATGERTWRMPLVQEYKARLKGDIADLKNTGGRPGGAIIAALFLEHFTEGLPWAHLDIAGSARSDKTTGYIPKGATGIGVRTLLAYLSR
ncbi:MAG: Cytosol aminopeptidase PepA [uncultured Thermomicrobiales bacterium]|uniref:Probable cytosol aminopeptidase n=1 Tax=uncultured Thermomicrobiales bacterium TaxID=1645740 RepID=A0A6J4ULX5_9BACT|nr:MAG: Cytosol aminopeptidase PepA [uncultured Thermomicrobiales bacterium]